RVHDRAPRCASRSITSSEDPDPVLRREPHAVTLADAERLVEAIGVAHEVGSQVGRGVWVDRQQSLGLLLPGLALPDLGIADVEALVTGPAVDLGGLPAGRQPVGVPRNRQTAQVADV